MEKSLIIYNKNQNNMNYPNNNIVILNNHLFVFHKFLEQIYDENLVIAGVNALKLHGLKMSREANDLDIVLFQPTKKQLDFLRSMSFFEHKSREFQSATGEKLQDENYPIDNLILKFKKDNYMLDIILSKEPTPEFLLSYKFKDTDYKIQNIALNIEAKNSYSVRNSDGLKYYRRVKDMIDFQDLKNSNFNID